MILKPGKNWNPIDMTEEENFDAFAIPERNATAKHQSNYNPPEPHPAAKIHVSLKDQQKQSKQTRTN